MYMFIFFLSSIIYSSDILGHFYGPLTGFNPKRLPRKGSVPGRCRSFRKILFKKNFSPFFNVIWYLKKTRTQLEPTRTRNDNRMEN